MVKNKGVQIGWSKVQQMKNNNAVVKTNIVKKRKKKKGINKNKLAVSISFIVFITLLGVMFVHNELWQFNEQGVKPIDYVRAEDPGPVSETRHPRETGISNNEPVVSQAPAETTKTTDNQGNVINNPSDPYYDMINDSSRINVLCFGLADFLLADTIFIVSLDPDRLTADVISIPRDTYYHTKGREEPYMKKINAYYYGASTVERTQNMVNTVSALMKVPIHYYVKIQYAGVIGIVDCIGGVEVDIPFDMDYDDPTDDLHIHFKAGPKLLDGQESLEYLRFRMNNDGTHSDGDIGRIYRQQDFIKRAIKKSMNLNLINVVNVAQNYVKTNMIPGEIISFTMKFMNIKLEDIKFHTLPGYPDIFGGGDYWVCVEEKSKEMITDIYKGIDKKVINN